MKYKLICKGCKKGVLLSIDGVKSISEIEITWTCKWCNKINPDVVKV